MSKKKWRKIAVLLLAASLALNIVGCGKSKESSAGIGGGDAVDFSGGRENGDKRDAFGVFADDADGADDADDVDEAMDFPDMSEESGSAGRNKIQEDFVIVPMPTISTDAFGNGFYDTYALIPPARESFDYDEDGLLTKARFPWGSDAGESLDAQFTLSYEKSGGMVTACELSADLYAWFLDYYSDAGARYSMAEERSEELEAKMPYRIVFDEPIEPDPDVVAEAVLGKVDETIEWLDGGLLPSMNSYFYEAFRDMYQSYLSGAWQTDGTETNSAETNSAETDGVEMSGPEISWDEDGLLTDVRFSFTTETDETVESWMALEYQKEEGLVTTCEISADMYAYFVYEYGCDEETAKEWSDELADKMPFGLVFEEPVNIEEREAVFEWTYYLLSERLESEADHSFVDFFEYSSGIYLEKVANGEVDNAEGDTENNAEDNAEASTAAVSGYEVVVGGIATREFEGRVNAGDLSNSYFFQYGGGIPLGEKKITNNPGWSINMSVSKEDVICQIETEEDSNGNITLVHLYNDYAIYDEVFTYDSAGRMTRYEHYEYPKGQNREAVGALWYYEYSYDSEGRLTGARSESMQDNGVNSEIVYYYDDMGRMVEQEGYSSYFGNDFMTMQQIYDSVVQSYDYDDSGKVAIVTVTVNWAQTVLQPEPTEPTMVVYLSEK